MSQEVVKSFATSVSAKLPKSTVQIDPATIITIITKLIPIAVECYKQMNPQASATDAKAYLQDHFDEPTQTFDQSLINRMRPQTRRTCRKNGDKIRNRSDLDNISQQTLLEAMNADDQTAVALFSAPVPSDSVLDLDK